MMNQTAAYPTMGQQGYASRDQVNGITLLDGEINKITDATDKVRSLTTAACTIADSVFGSQPPTAESKVSRVDMPYSGRGEGLRSATHALHEALAVLDGQLSRLNLL